MPRPNFWGRPGVGGRRTEVRGVPIKVLVPRNGQEAGCHGCAVSSAFRVSCVEGPVGTFSAARDAVETLTRVYLSRLPPTRHNRTDWMGSRTHVVSVTPSRRDAKRVTPPTERRPRAEYSLILTSKVTFRLKIKERMRVSPWYSLAAHAHF